MFLIIMNLINLLIQWLCGLSFRFQFENPISLLWLVNLKSILSWRSYKFLIKLCIQRCLTSLMLMKEFWSIVSVDLGIIKGPISGLMSENVKTESVTAMADWQWLPNFFELNKGAKKVWKKKCKQPNWAGFRILNFFSLAKQRMQ